MIFSVMRDKAVDEIATILWSQAEKLILTSQSNSRALTAEKLAAYAPKSFPKENIVKTETVEVAIKTAKAMTAEDGIIVITGSLYLVGEARKILLSDPAV
jgi:dihydrofolate synthase/folylpolyglutamate synthase